MTAQHFALAVVLGFKVSLRGSGYLSVRERERGRGGGVAQTSIFLETQTKNRSLTPIAGFGFRIGWLRLKNRSDNMRHTITIAIAV